MLNENESIDYGQPPTPLPKRELPASWTVARREMGELAHYVENSLSQNVVGLGDRLEEALGDLDKQSRPSESPACPKS